VHLTINGTKHEASDGSTLPMVLAQLGLEGKPCAVELNTNVVPKAQHDACTLADGDVLEIVTLVGGG
jgi:sulfur carrier protein